MFAGLLSELDISRVTLSATVQDLVDQGYVENEVLSIYRKLLPDFSFQLVHVRALLFRGSLEFLAESRSIDLRIYAS